MRSALVMSWAAVSNTRFFPLGPSKESINISIWEVVLRTSVYDTVDGGNSALAYTTIDHTYHSVRLGLNYHVPDGDAPLK